MIRVGFTGTQRGITRVQTTRLELLLVQLIASDGGLFRHGDCIGADEMAHRAAKSIRYRVCIHPPEDPKKRAWCVGDEIWPEKPYLTRNRDIVDNCDRMISLPGEATEQMRSGTWYTIRYARKMNRMTYIIYPDGRVQIENGR